MKELVKDGYVYLHLLNAGYDVKIIVELTYEGKEIYMTHFHRQKNENDDEYVKRIMARVKAWNMIRSCEGKPPYCLPIWQAKRACKS